ncbi:MAG TPA: Sir2 family NAD-dependent protein deacetylase [Kofleriaceae bacterium]|nr:Sir2 family NAD-dependent protein deacetylase [Kofleriaceae bacterium]
MDRLVIVLTGAGISAESGIPTFRGQEGYWTVGSRVYHPQELATHEAFTQLPWEVWRWYLWRRSVCRAARPNAAHLALVELERRLGDGFLLITQNVDGLHLRAGSSPERTYQVHGNIDFMRCAHDCTLERWPVPDAVGDLGKDDPLTDAQRALLRCPRCGRGARPHVLWFDESYDEERYRFASSLDAAGRAATLIIVGSTASTNLPVQVARRAARAGARLYDINIEDNGFGDIAGAAGGRVLRGPAATLLPELIEEISGPSARRT